MIQGPLLQYLEDYTTNPIYDVTLQQTGKITAVAPERYVELGLYWLAPIKPISGYAAIVANMQAHTAGIDTKDYIEKLIFADQYRIMQDEEEME